MPLLSTNTTGLPTGFQGGGGQAYTRQAQGNELVSTNLNRLLAGGSDYMQEARQSGLEVASGRGLLNSSIAAGSAQREAIRAGAPIAAGDAEANRQAAGENIQYLNQYEMADRANAAQVKVAQIGAGAQVQSARIGAESAMRQLEAQLGFAGQQADLNRAQEIMMTNLHFDQGLQEMAAQHGFDLDAMAGSAFYDLQNMAAIDQLNVRDMGMSFVMGSYNNYTQMMSNAMMGDFDTAAFARLVQSANNYLEGSIAFGSNLFGNFPPFEFNFTGYGDG